MLFPVKVLALLFNSIPVVNFKVEYQNNPPRK